MSDRTKYALDTEFLEDGKTIELISIGIISETGREYYAVSSDMPLGEIKKSDWLVRNVLPSLPLNNRDSLDKFLAHPRSLYPQPSIEWVAIDRSNILVKPKWVIANEVREFLLAENEPQLWADHAAYDHVALCQLWGRMIRLPDGIPMWTHDLQQALELTPEFAPPEQTEGLHNALDDARHVMRVLKAWSNVASHGAARE